MSTIRISGRIHAKGKILELIIPLLEAFMPMASEGILQRAENVDTDTGNWLWQLMKKIAVGTVRFIAKLELTGPAPATA